MKWKYQKKLTCLLWFGWILQSWTLKLVSVQLNQLINLITHLSFFFVVLLLPIFGLVWFSNDSSTVNSTNDFNGKKTNKTIFFETKTKITLIVCIMNRLMIFWWFFNKQKESWSFLIFSTKPTFRHFFLKSNQINWL